VDVDKKAVEPDFYLLNQYRERPFSFLPKDFIETAEGLVFAVVNYGEHDDKIGCFLRYRLTETGWQKVTTEQANTLLQQYYPHYLYYSSQLDASFHAVSPQQVLKHHRPERQIQMLLEWVTEDPIVCHLQHLIPVLQRYGADVRSLGVTGSLLLGCHKSSSDIDLAVYGRDAFFKTRMAVQRAVDDGALSLLDELMMRDNYQRRLGELAYNDFAWHENRKFNKAMVKGTKFDIGMVNLVDDEKQTASYQKIGSTTLSAKVIDDSFSFDFPARYTLDAPSISEIVVFTNTYVGQAYKGESVEVSGMIEEDLETGMRRLVVGSTREAEGEYIKVIERSLSVT